MMKRLLDILAAAAGLLAAAPLLAVVLFLVWRQDGHSPFYLGPRVGRGGRPFRMVKIRSMTVNADRSGVNSTAGDDRRITPVGAFVRRWKLDELTQLWNVLRGEMSLVGPRPQVAADVARYTGVERGLLAARPGITDFASIVFADEGDILRGQPDPDLAYNQLIRPLKSRLGLLYVQKRTLAVDLALVGLTLVAIVSRPCALAGLAALLRRLGAPPDLVDAARRHAPLRPAPPPGADDIVRTLAGGGAVTAAAAFQQAAFAVALALLSWVVTLAMVRVRIMDVPNDRSSHARATPRGGGVGIVAAFGAGLAALWFLADSARVAQGSFLGLAIGAFAIAAVSFIDDLRPTPLLLRLSAQVLGTGAALWFGLALREIWIPVVGRVELGWFGYALTAFWIVGVTNAMNFMDGLNGLVAGTATVAAAGLAAIAFLSGSHFAYLAALALAAGAAGFLPHNFPRARIFMGDVGSQFLGFAFAVLGLVAAQFDAQRTSFMIVPILLFAFLFDTGFTLARRLLAGERVTQAHRGHLYQVLQRAGWTHARVALLHWGFAALQVAAALVLLRLPADAKVLVFLPLLAVQLAYLALVVRLAARAGIGRW